MINRINISHDYKAISKNGVRNGVKYKIKQYFLFNKHIVCLQYFNEEIKRTYNTAQNYEVITVFNENLKVVWQSDQRNFDIQNKIIDKLAFDKNILYAVAFDGTKYNLTDKLSQHSIALENLNTIYHHDKTLYINGKSLEFKNEIDGYIVTDQYIVVLINHLEYDEAQNTKYAINEHNLFLVNFDAEITHTVQTPFELEDDCPIKFKYWDGMLFYKGDIKIFIYGFECKLVWPSGTYKIISQNNRF